MWANAKVDHGTAAVDSGGGAIGNFRLDELFLVLVVLWRMSDGRIKCDFVCTYAEHLKQSLLWHHETFELLLLLDRQLGDLLEGGVVGVGNWPADESDDTLKYCSNGLTCLGWPSRKRNHPQWEDRRKGGSHSDAQKLHPRRARTSARRHACLHYSLASVRHCE